MSLIDELTASLKNVPDYVYETRMDLCKMCPYGKYNSVTTQCTECGCFMPIKAKLESQQCPLGIWK